jgi:hypothetical protein
MDAKTIIDTETGRRYMLLILGSSRTIISDKPKDKEELEAINRAYRDFTRKSKLVGEFKWCNSPNCNKAFYDKEEKKYCSSKCKRWAKEDL